MQSSVELPSSLENLSNIHESELQLLGIISTDVFYDFNLTLVLAL